MASTIRMLIGHITRSQKLGQLFQGLITVIKSPGVSTFVHGCTLHVSSVSPGCKMVAVAPGIAPLYIKPRGREKGLFYLTSLFFFFFEI